MKINIPTLLTGGLVGITTCTGLVLTSVTTFADNDSATDEVNITVPVACTMTGTITTGQEHTATLQPGTYSGASGSGYENGIGKTTLATHCNDYNGFSIYAIGFTGETEGDNTLVGTSASGGATIPTKVYESTDTTSNWSMKVTKVTDSSATFNPANMTIANSFDSWHTVPDDYTKVAEYHASTGSSATDQSLGAKVETTYASYISTSQPADAYTGKVKYVMVHPYNHAAPIVGPIGPDPQESCNTPFPVIGINYMQDINSTNKTAVLSELDTDAKYYLRDSRDGEPYCVVKLANGNLWLADNLRLDLTDSAILAGMNDANTNASNNTLDYLKGTVARNPNTDPDSGYATSAVSDWPTNPTYSSNGSYSDPLINTDAMNSSNTSDPLSDDAKTWKYGVYYNYCAASAGSYCYGNGQDDYGEPYSDAIEDICPKNWHIPSYDFGAGELESTFYDYDTYDEYRSITRLSLPGYFYHGSIMGQGTEATLWSSSLNGSDYMHVIYAYEDYMWDSDTSSDRIIGETVRCILSSS